MKSEQLPGIEVHDREITPTMSVARFSTPIRSHIRLEANWQRAVALGWSVEAADVPNITPLLCQLGPTAERVLVEGDDHFRELAWWQRHHLGQYLARITTLDLVRIEQAGAIITYWGAVDELYTVTKTWERAGALAVELGAPDVAALVPTLEQQLHPDPPEHRY